MVKETCIKCGEKQEPEEQGRFFDNEWYCEDCGTDRYTKELNKQQRTVQNENK